VATIDETLRQRRKAALAVPTPTPEAAVLPEPSPAPTPYAPPEPPEAAGAEAPEPVGPVEPAAPAYPGFEALHVRMSPMGIPIVVGLPTEAEVPEVAPRGVGMGVPGVPGKWDPLTYIGKGLNVLDERGFQPLGGRIIALGRGVGFEPGEWTFNRPSWETFASAFTMEEDEARQYLHDQPGTTQFLAKLVPELALFGGKPGTLGRQAITTVKLPHMVYKNFKGMGQVMRTMDDWHAAARVLQAEAKAAGTPMSYTEAFSVMARQRGLFAEGRVVPRLPELYEYEPTKDLWLKVGIAAERMPGLGQLIHVINPSAREFSEAMLKAYQWNAALESGQVSVGIARAQAELLLGRAKFAVDTSGRVTNVTAKTEQGRRAGTFWHDIFENPEWYNLTNEQEVAVRHLWKLTDDFKDTYLAAGGKLDEIGFEAEAHHVPRLVTGRKGLENLRRDMGTRGRAIGGKKTWQRGRIYQFVAEGIGNQVQYEMDIMATYSATWQGLMSSTVDQRFISSLLPMGRKLTDLIPADIDLASVAGRQLVGWSRRLDRAASNILKNPQSRTRLGPFKSAKIEQTFPGVVERFNAELEELKAMRTALRRQITATGRLPRAPAKMPAPPKGKADLAEPAKKGFGLRTLKRVMAKPAEDRGITVRVNELEPRTGFAVQVSPEVKVTRLTGRDIDAFVAENADLLSRKGNSLGIRFDKENMVYEIAVSHVVPSMKQANALGIRYRQRYVYDLAKKVSMETKGYVKVADLPEYAELQSFTRRLQDGAVRDARISAGAAIKKRKDEMEMLMNQTRRPGGRLRGALFGRPEEDFIAVGQLDPSIFPGMRGRVFPEDVMVTLEATLGDAGSKWAKAMQDIASVSRTLGTTTDLNFGFLQGLVLLGRNPAKWAQAITNSFAALARPDVYQRYLVMKWHQAPATMERYSRYVASLGEPEFFAAARTGGLLHRGLGKVPVVGPVVSKQLFQRFAGAFDTFLDVARIEWWQSCEQMALARVAAGNLTALEDLGGVIRNGTGTSSLRRLGIARTQQEIEGAFFFFAPRYTRSLFAMVFDALHGGVRGNESRRALAGMAVVGGSMYAGIAYALGQRPNFDITHPGFMAVRIGDNWVGIGSGYRALLKLIGSSVRTASDDPGAFLHLWGEDAMDNPLLRFVRSRTSPVTSTAWDLVTGRDFIGRPTRQSWQDWAQLAQGRLSPFVVDAYLEANGGAADRWKAITGEFFFGRAIPASPSYLRDEAIAREGYVLSLGPDAGKRVTRYMDLAKDQRDDFDRRFPEYAEAVEEWRLSRGSPFSVLDDVSHRKLEALEAAAVTLANAGNDPYAGRAYRYTVMDLARYYQGEYNAARTGAQADDLQPRTEEQKLLDDYFSSVIDPSILTTGKMDYELFERYERDFMRRLSAEAKDRLSAMLGSAEDPVYMQFRTDKQMLGPYWDLMDSLWSKDALGHFGLGAAAKYASYEDYRSTMLRGLTDQLTGQRTPTGLRERFKNETLSREQAQQYALTIFAALTKDWSDFKTFVRDEYLMANPDQLKRLVTWGYMVDIPKSLEPYARFE